MTSLQLPPPRKTAPAMSQNDDESSSTSQALTSRRQLSNASSTADATRLESTQKTQVAPSYEERCVAAAQASKLTPEQRRQKQGPKLFVPRRLADFDDGGAFPEIHVAQYPRHMGNPHLKQKKNSNVAGSSQQQSVTAGHRRALVNVEVDKDGEVSYDAIVKSETNS
jgi:SNW domain-containing protein 1